jgi:hypothetical protein
MKKSIIIKELWKVIDKIDEADAAALPPPQLKLLYLIRRDLFTIARTLEKEKHLANEKS